ncbi:MAG TPA: cytochrome P450 [Mycobacterium sp.]|nr:cytochrome P450 [Mycobacterium sp.]
MATVTTDPVRLPPGPRIPKTIQGIAFLTALCEVVPALGRRYGDTFTINLPIFGKTVVISDVALSRELFSSSNELIERPTNLGDVFGPGSTFSLNGQAHLERRRVILPVFHGKRVGAYEHIIEEEVLRETADWPQGREFKTHESMNRLALNAILRTMFGDDSAALDELRRIVPSLVTVGSFLHQLPSIARRDLGRWSPGGSVLRSRRRFDDVIDTLIAAARTDPALHERSDVLAVLLQARYEDGQPIPDRHIADELLTLVGAGHETTANQLSWILERLGRHPELLARLSDEVDAGGSALRQATIYEAQRLRPSIEASLRRTKKRIRLGEWVIPEGTHITVNFQLAHESATNFSDPEKFDPDRFLDVNPKPFRWMPFGGGVNRCPGASFANMEMDIALRTLLREFRFGPIRERGERRRYRGVAITPSRGGRAIVQRRVNVPDRPKNAAPGCPAAATAAPGTDSADGCPSDPLAY